MSHITKFTRLFLWSMLAATTGALVIITSAYLYLSPNLPSVDTLRDVQLQTPLRVYTADEKLIGEFGEQRRAPIGYDEIPNLFVAAILSTEDKNFFSHHGVDVAGLLRAVSQLLLTGKKGVGGGTITMQVARNYFLTFEKTFSRKFKEIFLALQIERALTKQEILQLYVNKIFLGNRAYGFQAASQVYYGKDLEELSLAQMAMLAGIPKAPSNYNPLVNPSRALIRRDYILRLMRKLGYIDIDIYQEAVEQPTTATYHGAKLSLNAPYAAEMARKDMIKRFGSNAYTAGYKVYTTLDSELQRAAQQAVITGLLAYDQRHGYHGPEQNVLADSEEQNHELWLSTLANISSVGTLSPAVVSEIHEQAFTALLADGEEVTVEWENGIKTMRKYQTINTRGRAPKKAGEVVSLGDVVRLKKMTDGSWHMSQIPKAQAALVSLDSDNGAIVSLVGGFDYQQSKFNRVTQASRQPGSNFKPFIYTAALANGYTPASIINDAPIVFEDSSLESTWRPNNDTGEFYGPTRLRYALFKSRNVVSIRLLRGLGIGKAINYIRRFGFDAEQLPKDLSLALGSHSLRPMEIVSAYSVLSNGGYRVEPYLIDRIESAESETLYQAYPTTVCRDCGQEQPPSEEEPETEFATIEDILSQSEEQEESAKIPEAERVIDERVAYLIDSQSA
jgi:penicillin-binding protein 1A